VVRAGYTQANAGIYVITSKALVNGHSNKVVNIASTKMMKKVFAGSSVIEFQRIMPGTSPGILSCGTQPHAWLLTALPRAACAAASRAIGTR
jgi:hypothetical protein